MTDVQAALGLHQLARLDGFIERRAQIVADVQPPLRRPPGARPPEGARRRCATPGTSTRSGSRAKRLTIGRDELIEELKARGIGTSVHFIPIHYHPYYQQTLRREAGRLPQHRPALRRPALAAALPPHDRRRRRPRERRSGGDHCQPQTLEPSPNRAELFDRIAAALGSRRPQPAHRPHRRPRQARLAGPRPLHAGADRPQGQAVHDVQVPDHDGQRPPGMGTRRSASTTSRPSSSTPSGPTSG